MPAPCPTERLIETIIMIIFAGIETLKDGVEIIHWVLKRVSENSSVGKAEYETHLRHEK